MKRTLWVLALAVLTLLTGCGAEEVQEPTQPPLIEVQVPYEEPAAALRYQDVELTMRSVWQREDPQARVLLEAAEFFENQTGAVVTILWPDGNEAEAETDILQCSAADFASLPEGTALDLTEMAEKAGYAEKSHETLRQQIIDQCGYLGAVAQVPYLGGVYYNTEIFEECGLEEMPATWEEFLSVCQTLRNSGWVPLTLDKDDTLAATELHLRCALGTAEVARMMGESGRWDTNLPAIAAMEQVMLFRKEGNLVTGTPADAPAGQNKMALSNSAMMIGTNADCWAVEEATLMDLQWGIFPYPGGMGCGTYMTADVLVIHKDTGNAQAAFDFVMLLATGEFDQLRADVSCGIPADPANASPIVGAMEAIRTMQPEPLGYLGSKQLDMTVKLWGGWYSKAASYASLLELSK